MKYLQTYENIEKPSAADIARQIVDWMMENHLTKMNLPDIKGLGTDEYWTLKELICIDYYQNIIVALNKPPYREGEIGNCWFYNSNNHGTCWNILTLKRLLTYLESLSPEEIEQQRIENEAEKFNI